MEESQSGSDRDEDRSLKTAESLRAFRDQASQTLEEHKDRVGEIESRLTEQFELITEELARERLDDEQHLVDSAEQTALLEKLQQTLAEKEAEVEEVLEQLATQSLDFEAQLAERDEELEQVLELGEEECQQRETLEQELGSARQALENAKAEACTECAESRKQVSETDDKFQQLDEQYKTLQSKQESQQTELEKTIRNSEAVQKQNKRAALALADAEQRILELSQLQQDSEEQSQQLEKTRRKFDLALADVQKLKRENAELREELLSRPEADDQESPELVSLRSERDALAERISELEKVPAPEESDDNQKAREDLQRRFELAVDDVRQLKQENADFLQQLKAAQSAAASGSKVDAQDDGPLDWQAQKALLMAELDAEDLGTVDDCRREERATIDGTISITDRVVAEKDTQLAKREAEVAGLQEQLESRPAGDIDQDQLRDQIAAEILGDDEAVQAECAKLQEQQKELNGKLREAELEISVQRATLAREQAALEEKLARLPAEDSDSEKSSGGKPRRRWLSALGIKDDED